MAMAINGCLLVAMLFTWGAITSDATVMGAAMASAMFSWIANVCSELQSKPLYQMSAAAAVISFVGGVAAIG
jgi:hypothetical protein